MDTLLCAHNPCPQNGKSKLKQKLQFLEDIVGQVQNLKAAGITLSAIYRQMDPGIDKWVKLMTMGNVSFVNMLRSAYQLNK
jgi:hypothetical protein